MYKVKRYQAYSLILITFFIQISLSKFFVASHIKPNLMIIITVFFALFTDRKFGFETGLVSGLLLDIFSVRFFGLNAILFALGGYLVGRYNNKFYKESIITHAVLTFAISFFIFSTYFLFVSIRSLSREPYLGLNFIFNPSILIPSLLNSFLCIWIYAFLARILRLGEDI